MKTIDRAAELVAGYVRESVWNVSLSFRLAEETATDGFEFAELGFYVILFIASLAPALILRFLVVKQPMRPSQWRRGCCSRGSCFPR
jgi:hypothetical protein